jgi:hypothetical protein
MAGEQQLPTTKSFGFTFAALFLIIAGWPWVFRGDEPRYWAIALALFFAAAPFIAPRTLGPLNWLWFRFGMLLHGIVNPIIMALIYFAGVLPIGLLLKAFRKDLLRLEWQPADQLPSYWIARVPPGPKHGSMLKQF